MGVFRQLAGQTVLYGLSSVLPRVLNYFLVALHSRVFTPSEYGTITELYAYVAILLVLLTYGLETGFFRFASKESGENSRHTYGTIFWFLFASSALFVSLCVLFQQPIASFIGYPGQGVYVSLLAAIIGVDAFSAIVFDRLRLEGRALAFSGIKMVSVLVNVGLNLFFLLGFPLLGISIGGFGVGYVLLANLISSVVALAVALFKTGGFPSLGSIGRLYQVIVFSFPLLLGGFGGTANDFFDRFFIRNLCGEDSLAQLGIYGANVKIAVLMVLVIQMFKYAAEPFFFRNASESESNTIYANVTKVFTYFCYLVLLGILFGLPLLKYFVGSDYRVGLGVIPILLVANLFYGLYFNVSFWFKLSNRTWFAILFTGVGLAVTVLVNLLLIPRIGYFGAAWARAISYAVMVVLCVLVGMRYMSIPYDWRRISLAGVMCTLIAVAGVYSEMLPTLAMWAIKVVLFLLFFYLLLRIEGMGVRDFRRVLKV